MRRHWAIVLALVITSCATVDDSSVSPVAVPRIEDPLRIDLQWFHAPPLDGGRRSFLAPRVIAGVLYTGDDRGHVTATDAASGRVLWRRRMAISLSSGFGSAEGLVLVGGREGEVIALAPDSGVERWRGRVSSEVLARPSGGAGVVVVHSNDGKVYGLDDLSGRRLWVYEYPVPRLTLRGVSSPVVLRDRVIVGLPNGMLLALGLYDGKVLWEAEVAVPRGRTELERLIDVSGDPVVHGGVVYAAAYQGRVAAVDLSSGQVRWTRELSSYRTPLIAHGVLYLVNDRSHVLALDLETGGTLWRQEQLAGRYASGVAAVGEYLVVADAAGQVYWLAQESGRFLARRLVDASGVQLSSGENSGLVYVVGNSGLVEALRAQGK